MKSIAHDWLSPGGATSGCRRAGQWPVRPDYLGRGANRPSDPFAGAARAHRQRGERDRHLRVLQELAVLQAGGDLVLICHRPEVQREALDAVRRAVARGEIPASRLEEARARIRRGRALAVVPRFRPSPPGLEGFPAHRALARRLTSPAAQG